MPDFTINYLIDILKKTEIFVNLPDDIIEELADKLAITDFNNNDYVITKGDLGNSMHLILSGSVKVHDGEVVLAEMKEGSFFGEFSLLDDEPRSLSVSATAPIKIGTITQTDFSEILNQFPALGKDILKVMLRRLRNQNGEIIQNLKKKQNELEALVEIRTKEIQEKNQKLETMLTELNQTQNQLVQSEKMAAFGAVASRVAHEIQNPLNFVNNFSQLSKELIKDILYSNDEEEKKECSEALIDNLDKIYIHGKRAADIVLLLNDHSNKGTAHTFFENT